MSTITLANMGLRNVANLFDYVNDSLDGDRAWSNHDEWTEPKASAQSLCELWCATTGDY